MPKKKVKEKPIQWCVTRPVECDGSCCKVKKKKGGN
jgi:hypothetical protein